MIIKILHKMCLMGIIICEVVEVCLGEGVRVRVEVHVLGGECEGVGGDRELLAVQYVTSLVSGAYMWRCDCVRVWRCEGVEM